MAFFPDIWARVSGGFGNGENAENIPAAPRRWEKVSTLWDGYGEGDDGSG